MKRIQSPLSLALGRRLNSSAPRNARFAVLALAGLLCSFFIAVPTVFVAGNMQKGAPTPAQGQKGPDNGPAPLFHSAQARGFAETIPLRDMKSEPLTPEQRAKLDQIKEEREKNENNRKPIKSMVGAKDGPFADRSIDAGSKAGPNLVTNPIANFDGIDMDDEVASLGFGRFAPPDTNSDTGPNHVVMAINSALRIYNKTGTPLTATTSLGTLFSTIGGPCAGDTDGDPIVLYDPLADRWLISEFCVDFTVNNSMHELIAISKTGDPTGAYFLYDFLMPPGRFTDYPHFGVWTDGYYMTTNDFNTSGTAFLGDSFIAFNRAKMLAGDPTANYVGFSNNLAASPLGSGGFLPTDIDGLMLPPAGTPNLIIQFLADEFGDPIDGLRIAEFVPNFTTPASSTLTQLPDVPLTAFDARQPASGAIDQPPPAAAADSLDAIADRLMHRLAYRRLQDSSQSYVLNFTVNVSGVNPTNAATYQGGVRWVELRRNSGTGAMTVNQQATYAPGSGNGATGRNLWMASVAEDGEGNIGLAASATGITPALNPTAIYTGRLFADPLGTTPQGEVDAMSAVTRGVQTGTFSRWGDYSSLMVDPADECTFWGTFEYVDSPTASFDWNTRIFSFKVNPSCVTAPRGTFSGTITNCVTGLPIQDAIVETTNPAGFFRTTPANGTYSITAAPGTYDVKVSKPGASFNMVTGMVTVTNGGNAIFNACLQPSAIIVSAGATLVTESCSPPNGVIDPGETVTVSFCVQNTGGLNTTNLVGTLQATGGVTGPSGPQNYGVVVAGGPAVCRNFTFTAAGTCGGTLTASIQFQDGATNLGTLTYTFTLGVLNVAFQQNFDGVVAPALPAGWTATQGVNVAGAPLWVTSSAGTPAPPADTAPNAIFTPDPNNLLDNRIDTPTIAVTTATAVLTFRNNFNLESTFDGGVVEISIAAGPFTDIIAAGGSFVGGTQGYNATINSSFGSPIAGRQAFSGNSAGFVTTGINLPAAAAGQNIVLRFRMGSDNSVGMEGWRVDTIRITDGFVCCAASVVPCAENFDSVTPPALPAGWSATVGATCANTARWATDNSASDTPPNSAFVNDPNCISDERLDSKSFPIVSASAVLTFRRSNNLESTFDGMVLEISIGGGAFQDILAAGGTFGVGGYNGTISASFGNPIGGRQAWTGNSGGFVTTTVNLPASANGQGIVLRWRRGSDSSVSAVGAFIDTISITGSNCGATCNSITCPGNITQSNDPNQCGAVVNYPAPTTNGTCAPPTCSPASGSFFPKGTTTVTCTTTGPPQLTCTFTVTINDTQPPTIACPANVTAVTDQSLCPSPSCLVVTYPPPVATDNCPGVTVACNPPSGSCFPVGVTTVTCTATDTSGNTATCTFTVTTFDVALQDDSDPSIILLWNSITGQYRFCCNGVTYTGVGKPNVQGCIYTLDGNAPDRRIVGRADKAAHAGQASIQAPPGTLRCTITDRSTFNDTLLPACQ